MVTGNDDLEDINFPLNSSVVVDGFQGLDLLASVMAKHENLELEVIGHTDSIGSVPYNKRLSLKRAEQVKAYLVTKGASEGKITTNGDGVDTTYDNASREGRFQNRRVSLMLYEINGAVRSKVTYPRLLELFFGGPGSSMQALEELKEKSGKDNAEVLAKLSDLQKQLNAMNDALQRRIGNLEKAHAELAQRTEDLPTRASMAMQVGKYTGVSVSAGVDDESEFTGQIRGMYFRTIGEHFAVQAQGDASYYDSFEDGQADLAAVYQNGGFKLAAAGSYRWASLPGLDAVRVAQGALIADWRFGSGKFGVFGTFPIADGDVIGTSNGPSAAYTVEHYVSVPTQVGLDFGVSIGDRLDLSGYAASLDAEQSDADLSAGVKLDVLIKDNLSWFVTADMNESLLDPTEDLTRYQIGLKLGSWTQARYNVTDQITPVNIPRVHYELLS
jgi:flagellar motor protein MotB